MQNSTSFFYFPKQLSEVARYVEQKHGRDITKQNSKDEQALLASLKAQLRTITSNNLYAVAFQFTTHELYLLCSNIISLLNEEGLANRVLQVLNLRMRKGFVIYFWNALQESPTNISLQKILYDMLLKVEKPEQIMKINKEYSSKLINILTKENLVIELANYIKQSNEPILDYLNHYNIRSESILCDRVIVQVLATANSKDFSNIPLTQWWERQKNWSIENKAKVLNQYWLVFDTNKFDNTIMNEIERQYGMPDYERQRFFWSNIGEDAKIKFRQWYFTKTLEIFFTDNERLQYWKKWVFAMKNMYYVKKREQLFMDFGSVVIIEFGHTGNAAYFYESKYFYKYLFHYTRPGHDVPNQYLKGQFQLDKFDHRGTYWSYYMDMKLAIYGVKE